MLQNLDKYFADGLTYSLMLSELRDYDHEFISKMDRDLRNLVHQNFVLMQSVVEELYLPVFVGTGVDSILSEVSDSDRIVLTEQERETLALVFKKFVTSVLATAATCVELLQKIENVEKMSISLIVSLLRSFGLYAPLFQFPIPLLRRLLYVLVHFYKRKGSKYVAKRFLSLTSFGYSKVVELYSYRTGPFSYSNNLYFYGYEDGREYNIHYLSTIDPRWCTNVTDYIEIDSE